MQVQVLSRAPNFMGNVLVLNKTSYAIQIVSWRRALTLLYQGNAEAVDDMYRNYSFETWKELSKAMAESPNGFINTPKFRIAIPHIIRLTKFDKLPKKEVRFTRRNIYEHYNYTCCYCLEKFSTSNLNLDHVIPKSKGGKTNWTNIVTACIPCNTRKMDKKPEEVGMKLKVKPTKPTWKGPRSIIEFPNGDVPIAWQRIIDANYWDSQLEKK